LGHTIRLTGVLFLIFAPALLFDRPNEPITGEEQQLMSPQSNRLDGRDLSRDEANMLVIELNRLPAGSEAGNAAALVKRAVSEKTELPLTAAQAATLRRAVEGIRLKRHSLPPGLSQLRARLQT
jgi:hypothetical protein